MIYYNKLNKLKKTETEELLALKVGFILIMQFVFKFYVVYWDFLDYETIY